MYRTSYQKHGSFCGLFAYIHTRQPSYITPKAPRSTFPTSRCLQPVLSVGASPCCVNSKLAWALVDSIAPIDAIAAPSPTVPSHSGSSEANTAKLTTRTVYWQVTIMVNGLYTFNSRAVELTASCIVCGKRLRQFPVIMTGRGPEG